jgi:hypothetical protein
MSPRRSGIYLGTPYLQREIPVQFVASLHPDRRSEEDTDFENAHPGKSRNVPLYGKTNSKRDKAQYELDIRYTYTTKYHGTHRVVIEIMNATNYQAREYYWDYRYSYSKSNPKFKKSNGIAFLPTFGVEAKF